MASQKGAVDVEIPPKPFVVWLYEWVERYGLWDEGGLGDQPYYLMWDLQIVNDVIK